SCACESHFRKCEKQRRSYQRVCWLKRGRYHGQWLSAQAGREVGFCWLHGGNFRNCCVGNAERELRRMVNPRFRQLIRGRSTGGMVFRGLSQGMRVATVNLVTGGTSRSRCFRSRHYSCVPFRYFQVALPYFGAFGSNPIADALFTGSQAQLFNQVGFLYPAVNSFTGIPARQAVTFSGLNYNAYDNATFDGSVRGHVWSDIMDAGQIVPAFAPFEFWTTIELPAGVWNNNLPAQRSASNFLPRFLGAVSSTNSQIAALGGASDVALTASSITAVTSAQAGAQVMFTPAMIRIGVDASVKSYVGLGDSLSDGVGEGTDTADTSGDSLGDALGNAGLLDRGL